jgi:replication factor C subunit 1
MYTSIYRPKKIENFIGNKEVIQPFIKWLLEWEYNDNKNKCALVSGITGIGKSLLVELILKKHDYNIINLDIDEGRSKEYINSYIKPLTKTKKSFDGQENALVVSDIDSGGDYGFISCLIECIKETKIPIICICDDRYSQSIKPILNYCFDIKMTKPKYDDVYRLVYDVVINEKIKIKQLQIKQLYEQSNGDIRFILNSLQLNIFNCKNIQSSNIFETSGLLFSMDKTIEQKNEIYWSSPDIHTLMVQENYINNIIGLKEDLGKIEKLSYSADALSDADLFEPLNDVNMTNLQFGQYIALNTIRATSNCNKKTIIKFPQYLGRISTQNKNKREKIDYKNIKFLNNEENNDKNKKAVKRTTKTNQSKNKGVKSKSVK